MAAQIEVRVVQLALGKRGSVGEAERQLAALRNAGWEFALAGGGTGRATADTIGFVILERDKQPTQP